MRRDIYQKSGLMRLTQCLLLVTVLCTSTVCSAIEYDTAIKPAAAQPDKYLPQLRGKRVAVVVNQTSITQDGLLPDALLKEKIDVRRIFVPEHGFRGKEDAGAHIDNTKDSATGLQVVSLYGKHKQPTAEELADVDVLVYDLQDVGVRFYTYISTLQYCMEACAREHKQLIVLDRPNPNGFYVDGPVLDTANRSFVGMQPIPVVYGMTAGEYAKMLKGEQWVAGATQLDLVVVPCAHYTHKKKYKLPVAPSPNLRTMAAIYAYPSLCMFEGTAISVGRGTDQPFQQYGCPEFAGSFSYSFTPRSMIGAKTPPYEGKTCFGELVGTDEDEVLRQTGNSFTLKWLIRAYNAYPDKDKFFNSFFVKLYGDSKGSGQVRQGVTEAAIRATWQPGLKAFKQIRSKYLIYP